MIGDRSRGPGGDDSASTRVLRRRTWHLLHRQTEYSVISAGLPLILMLVFAMDLMTRQHLELPAPFVVTGGLLYALLATIPLVMGGRYPRWAGVAMVIITECWLSAVLFGAGHAHAELNVLLQLPPIALYAGWFFKFWPALVCMVFAVARGLLTILAGEALIAEGLSPAITVGYAIVIALFCFFTARAIRAKAEAQLTIDSLTGVLNRRGLFNAGAQTLRRARGSGATVVIVDLDGLKTVNDLSGHAAGDAMLIREAGRLKQLVQGAKGRCEGVIGRIGGDEFVIIRTGEAASARQALTAIKARDQAPWTWGIAQVQPAETLAAALNRADAELRLAKSRRSH